MTIGFQYSLFSDKVTIGGHVQFLGDMQNIINGYFSIEYEKIKGRVTTRNKIKFVFKCKFDKVNEAIRRLKEDGIEFKPVKILERIWW
jgi:3-deoxy-D-manno-octulosonic acid (KDO) 8-phosphate synthase